MLAILRALHEAGVDDMRGDRRVLVRELHVREVQKVGRVTLRSLASTIILRRCTHVGVAHKPLHGAEVSRWGRDLAVGKCSPVYVD